MYKSSKFLVNLSFALVVFSASSVFLYSCQETAPETKKTIPKLVGNEFSIQQLQEAYKQGDYTIEEVVQTYLNRIEAIDRNGPNLNSVLQINPDALSIAHQLDEELKTGKWRGPLHGIPVLLKDNIDTHDKMETTAGSRYLIGSYPLNDSWVAMKLKAAGVVILGKANLSEWANFRGEMSSSGWSGVGGQTKNPYILDCNPCGSSSGSGVAVAANLCVMAIGTETNGSIVCPSTANGIVGLKPTVGLISRSGIVPISYTQDTPGPMTRTVTDAAICLGTMVGIDSSDSKTLESIGNYHSDYSQFLKRDGLKGKRIGWYKKPSGLHYKVDDLMEQTIEKLKSEGATIIEIDEIYSPKVNELSFTVMLYEFKDGLNKYFAGLEASHNDKSLQGLIDFNVNDPVELTYFDQELLIMAQEKGDIKDEEYKKAVLEMLSGSREQGIDRIMDSLDLDAIVAPTGSPAWKTDHTNGDHFILSSSSPAAISGYPNITVPMGFVDGLPVGVSFFGRAWSESQLIEMAFAYEQSSLHRQPPQLIAN